MSISIGRCLSTTLLGASILLLGAATSNADETCMSPYMAKIVGQEDFVYVWTLGLEGLGDEQDKLVTIDVRPGSDTYGKVVQSLSVGGRGEAHHSGFTDDRRFLWASTLDTNKIMIFDVHTDPAKPSLVKTIDDFVEKSGGVVGPHTSYALPGRMLVTAPIRSPPALPPMMASRSRDVKPSAITCSAQAMKSVNVFFFFKSLPFSYHGRPMSLPPRMWAMA